MKAIINFMFVITFLAKSFFVLAQKQTLGADTSARKTQTEDTFIKFDDTRKLNWPKEFEIVEITSSKDAALQKAYFYKSTSNVPQPLIVSLHTWSGNYTQRDEIAPLCMQKDINYIHPDFRGENKTISACCSDLALTDIDDAITYTIKNVNVDTNRIYVMGVSGGGYATLSTFMKSKHRIKKFSAWASITNLEAWYHESTIRKNKYAADIFACTGSAIELNVENAMKRSPLFMKTLVKKLNHTKLFIFAGIYDGIQGSVTITHSINFYNKLIGDLSVKDSSKYVSDKEKLELLEYRRPLGMLGGIGGRKVCLQKRSGNVTLTIFEGDHEMLPEYALNELLKD